MVEKTAHQHYQENRDVAFKEMHEAFIPYRKELDKALKDAHVKFDENTSEIRATYEKAEVAAYETFCDEVNKRK